MIQRFATRRQHQIALLAISSAHVAKYFYLIFTCCYLVGY
jgi:hypothetical protein